MNAKLGPDHGYEYDAVSASMHSIKALEKLGDKIFYKNYIALLAIESETDIWLTSSKQSSS